MSIILDESLDFCTFDGRERCRLARACGWFLQGGRSARQGVDSCQGYNAAVHGSCHDPDPMHEKLADRSNPGGSIAEGACWRASSCTFAENQPPRLPLSSGNRNPLANASSVIDLKGALDRLVFLPSAHNHVRVRPRTDRSAQRDDCKFSTASIWVWVAVPIHRD
jgi:hypothetical protein